MEKFGKHIKKIGKKGNFWKPVWTILSKLLLVMPREVEMVIPTNPF